MKHTIIHTADIQVQVREKNLRSSYEHCLSNITEHLIKTNADIYVVVGDLFEYAQSNDAEKSIMYEHLSKVLSLESIKEVVIMCGNHDIEKSGNGLMYSNRRIASTRFTISSVRSTNVIRTNLPI